jgi:hypothetical protein
MSTKPTPGPQIEQSRARDLAFRRLFGLAALSAETRRATAMTTVSTIQPDQAKVEEFVERALRDFSATWTTLMCALGERVAPRFHNWSSASRA